VASLVNKIERIETYENKADLLILIEEVDEKREAEKKPNLKHLVITEKRMSHKDYVDNFEYFALPTQKHRLKNKDPKKEADSIYLSDHPIEEELLINRLRDLYVLWREGKHIIWFPYYGVGVGESNLHKKAPKIFKKMTKILTEHFVPDYAKMGKKEYFRVLEAYHKLEEWEEELVEFTSSTDKKDSEIALIINREIVQGKDRRITATDIRLWKKRDIL